MESNYVKIATVSGAGKFLALILGVLAPAPMTHAATRCPWLNAATASGLLGGRSSVEYSQGGPGQPAVCTFADSEAGFTRTLTIRVDILSDAHAKVEEFAHGCSAGAVTVASIGNEAYLCTLTDRKGPHGERIVGRVRDQLFSITIGTSTKNTAVLHQDMLRMHMLTAAEQVSGNLF